MSVLVCLIITDNSFNNSMCMFTDAGRGITTAKEKLPAPTFGASSAYKS